MTATLEPTGAEFEQQVRSVARALWPKPGEGAAEILDGRERDCVFPTEELTHYIECTTKRTLEKVRDDAKKIVDYRERAAKQGTLVKGWIITLHEPTADQRTEAKTKRIEILSLIQFRRKLIDGQAYIDARNNYPFGSATDPETESTDVSNVRYQPTTIREQGSNRSLTVPELASELLQDRCIALVGDFGLGKSLTVRQIYRALQKSYSTEHTKLPLVLNLREHWGQTDVAEALHRHAKNIGFPQPHQLVRAFRAGIVVIILDGFDEMAPTSWNTRSEPRLRDLRRDSSALVAEFARAARGKTGILVVGRQHFFDSDSEMRESLALRRDDPVFKMDDFTDAEAGEFLKSHGFKEKLPDWLPRRPLLLAHLAAKGILQRVLDGRSDEPDAAWDSLIDRIAEREALIHKTLDAETVRLTLEYLASQTRSQRNEYGEITGEDIVRAFRSITGAEPDALARPLLNRLPGLGVLDPQKGTRTFIDAQMLDVLRGGEVARLIDNPWIAPESAKNWQQGLGTLGTAVAVRKVLAIHGAGAPAMAKVAAREAVERHHAPTLAADAVQVARETVPETSGPFDLGGIRLDGATFQTLDFSAGGQVSGITLQNCDIAEVVLPSGDVDGISINSSFIHRIGGCSKPELLPNWMSNCEVTEFDSYSTKAQILDRDELPMPLRVAMTILRKLYLQRGQGRKENALFRGIGPSAQQWVSKVLTEIHSEGVAIQTKVGGGDTIWHSVAGMRRRVMAILDAPTSSQDPIVVACRRLSAA